MHLQSGEGSSFDTSGEVGQVLSFNVMSGLPGAAPSQPPMSTGWSAETLLRGARLVSGQPAGMMSSIATSDPELLQQFKDFMKQSIDTVGYHPS